METMEIMEQLARKEPKVRKETKEILDQEESGAIMDPKARRVTLGFPQSYRYNISGSYCLQANLRLWFSSLKKQHLIIVRYLRSKSLGKLIL